MNYNEVLVRESAVLTTSYVAATVLSREVVNPQLNKQVSFVIDVTLGSLSSVEVQVFGSVDGTNYAKMHNESEYSYSADGTYILSVPALLPYVKVQVKGSGTVTSSLCKITAVVSDSPWILGQLAAYDAAGNQKVTQATALNSNNDGISAYTDDYNYEYISTATTTAIKDAPGYVKGLLLCETAAGAITVNDGSNTVAVLKASIAEGYYPIEAYFATDIEVVTAAASKLTVIYR